MGQTVNLLSTTSVVRIHLSPQAILKEILLKEDVSLNPGSGYKSGSSSIGRAPAFQAGGCGFETRLPLKRPNDGSRSLGRGIEARPVFRSKKPASRFKHTVANSARRIENLVKVCGLDGVPKKQGLLACKDVRSFER